MGELEEPKETDLKSPEGKASLMDAITLASAAYRAATFRRKECEARAKQALQDEALALVELEKARASLRRETEG